jgi:hypothetical protein
VRADARSGAIRRQSGRRSYARYPHYPQAESAWIVAFFVTASGCGRDDFPATGDSLPSHSPSRDRAGRLRAARRIAADGRAADEAAARRKLRACPLANAKAACFVKRPSEPRAFGLEEPDRRDTGPSGSGPARQKAGLRSARCHRLRRSFGSGGVGQDRASARELRTRQGPRASAHGLARRNQGFGFGSCRTRNQGLRPEEPPRQGTGASAPNPLNGEPPGLRP